MANPASDFSTEDVRRFSRRLTLPLASLPSPPTRVEAHTGKGFHLLLWSDASRILHLHISPARQGQRAPICTPASAITFRGREPLSPSERSWLAALRRGLAHAEREPRWADFLLWAALQPAVMLPDATYDPDRDAAAGNRELVRLETRCNGRCGFCSARGILPDLVLDADQIARRFRAMRRMGRRSVALTGGEPTLRKDLPELVALAAAEGFTSISLLTNAMRLDRGPLLGRLLEAGLTSLFVPFLSHRAEQHDALIGVRGAFQRTVAGVDRAREAGLLIAYNTVVTRSNMGDMPELMAWIAERFPATRIAGNISFVALQGWALDHLELIPRLAEVRPHLEAALDMCEARGMEMTIPGLCGLPMCVLPGYERRFEEYTRGFSILPENRRYGAPCNDCSLRGRCSGFWTAYLDRFGEDELGYPADTRPPD